MAQTKCLFLTGAFILVLALGPSNSQTQTSVTSNHSYGYFNGTSSVTLRSSTWDMQLAKEVTFRTCMPNGTFLLQSAAANTTGGARQFRLYLHNGTAVFEWQVASGISGNLSTQIKSLTVGRDLANSQQYTIRMKNYLGTIYLNVTQFSDTALFSVVVANSSHNSALLTAAIRNTDLHIGQQFVGCLYSGPGVNLNGDVVADRVVWNSCPLQGVLGCSIEDQDSDDCINIPCQNGGTCQDLFRGYICKCPRNFNGTNCEIDVARQFGCQVSPCINNGTCLSLATSPPGALPYRCICPHGFTGTNCEVELNECQRIPCGQGVCINLVNSYSCNCTGTGFRGENCSEDINECDHTQCGTGTCYNIPGSYSCECPAGRDGPSCQDINECESSPCQNGATCRNGLNSYTCVCVGGFTGVNCEVNINDCIGVTCPGQYSECRDKLQNYECICKPGYTGTPGLCTEINECNSNPCRNNATCTNLINAYRCDCRPGFTGVNCEVNINDCATSSCENNSTCIDGINSYTCLCGRGFTGANCSINIDDCVSHYCQNGATCVDLVAGYMCICSAGWTGPTCEVDFNECYSNPCQNGGTCNDFLGFYNCTCPPGFTGHNCQINVNECQSNPCMNGATCVDGINDYSCNCSIQWMGKNCSQVYDACSFQPCRNNATCSTVKPSQNYTCNCLVGYTGRNCATNIDDCVGNNCALYQVCYDGINNYTCGCPKGFEGANCGSEINECLSNPCRNNATCVDGMGNYTCNCKLGPGNPSGYHTGYKGVNCEMDVNECEYNPAICLNGGICRNSIGSYSCNCPGQTPSGELYTGHSCEIVTSYCIASGGSPCKNGATCQSITAGYVCHCVPGYTDKNCSTNINECASDPCQHGGTCHDGINNYTCDCIPGITGANCETNINDCEPNPCNLGACEDSINDYTCDCFDTGFSGDNCQNNINDCMPDSCQHNGTCVDGIKNFTCNCTAAYTGWQCDTDIAECASNPCQYGGRCLEYSNQTLYQTGYPGFTHFSYDTAAGYKCECIVGITGMNCETNINDCVDDACENRANCVDLINDYKCECPPGYTGRRCEMEIDECEPHPCLNGATCDDLIADYSCQCLEFSRNRQANYGGKNCSIRLRGCDGGSQCVNGYCVPFLVDEVRDQHDYQCRCDPGFTGRFCSQSTTITFKASGSEMHYLLNQNNRGSESFSFRFRTTLTNAVIVVYSFTPENFVSIEIRSKNLEVLYRDASSQISQMVDTQDYVNNAEWHQVHVALEENISVSLVSGSCGSERCLQQFSYPRGKPSVYLQTFSGLYFGHFDVGLVSKTLTNRTYVGCMEDVIYDNAYLFPGQQAGVYLGMFPGCPRTVQCDPYTCNRHGSCVDLWDSFQCNCDRPYWNSRCEKEYTAATFHKDGVPSSAVFGLTRLGQTAPNLHVSLFLRTRQDSSVIMYLGNQGNSSGALTYITLELQNGLLAVRVHLCADQGIFTNSSGSTIKKGLLNFVQLQLTSSVLMLKINGTVCVNEVISRSACPLQPSSAYLGMAPPSIGSIVSGRYRRQVSIVSLDQQSPFNGVIQDVEIQGYKLDFYSRNNTSEQNIILLSSQQNLTFGAVSTESVCNTSSPCENGGTCKNVYFNDFECICSPGYLGKNCSQLDFCKSDSCPSGTRCQSLQQGFECIGIKTFDGQSSRVVYRPALSSHLPSQQISFTMRTRSYYGAIFETRLNNRFIKVRVWDGTVEVNYLLKDTGRSEVLRSSSLVRINDGDWYHVEVFFDVPSGMSLRISNNGSRSIVGEGSKVLTDVVIDLETLITRGTIYVGDVADQKEQSFQGCLEEVRIGGLLLPFINDSQMNNQKAVDYFSATSLLNVVQGCQGSSTCQGNLCRHGSTCIDTWNDYQCQCPAAYSGKYCQMDVNECSSGPCLNNGLCQDGIGRFTCVCRPGYTGTRCETTVNYCTNSTCANDSKCVTDGNVSRGYLCTCTNSSYTGKDCNVQVDQNCSARLCQNGGTCSNITNQNVSTFNCSCSDGYTGPLCELEVNYCKNLPCKQGTCISNAAYQNYSCQCPSGYTGVQCETNINDCLNITCQNSGVCEDGVNEFFCNCTNGRTGVNCGQDVNECAWNICMHGTCENRPGNYICNCTDTGYSGDHCEREIDECKLNFCKHGDCNDTEGSFICNCSLGYSGQNCSKPVCEPDVCLNGSTCTTNHTDWMCNCLKYYAGRRCNYSGPCAENPCFDVNTEECLQDDNFYVNNSMNYTCRCKSGWQGDNCTIDIDECSNGTHQCENGATCWNTDGSYNCSCASGYTGSRCETDIDECESNPCQHGGTCTQGINSFTCNCIGTGYNGTVCHDDIDECLSGAVCGNGSCTNTPGNFTCNCGTMYVGERCGQVNHCHPAPCKNDAMCNHTEDGQGFVCSCVNGYQGKTCEQSPQTSTDVDVLIIVGPIIAVILVIIIIAAIAFIMVARNKRATRGAYSPSQQETAGSRVELGNVLKKPPEERLI